MDAKALRDHAEEILRAVIKDIKTPQTPAEQIRKSEGRALRAAEAPRTAAETHIFEAFVRGRSGHNDEGSLSDCTCPRRGYQYAVGRNGNHI
jgi:hypothetical protein